MKTDVGEKISRLAFIKIDVFFRKTTSVSKQSMLINVETLT